MGYPRILVVFAAAALAAALSSCSPSITSGGSVNTDIDSQYVRNISTLYGYGDPIYTDSTKMRVASDFTWKDSLGIKHSLSELKGQVVIVNFWTTWCPPCAYEMPDLQSTADSMAAKGVRVIGISEDTGDAIFSNVQGYVDYMKLSYQIIIDPKMYTYHNYGGSGSWPMSFVIDQTGHIAFEFVGKTSKQQFIAAVNRLL